MSSTRMHRAKKEVFRHVRLALECLEERDMPSSTLPALDTSATNTDYAAEHILVRWLDNASAAAPAESSYLGNNTWSVRLQAGSSVADTVAYYSQLAGIDFAQPDYV